MTQRKRFRMKTMQLDEIQSVIRKLQHLLNRLQEGSPEHEEMIGLISRAEKQRDELTKLDEKGERFVKHVKEIINS